jgi:hypothetical protein
MSAGRFGRAIELLHASATVQMDSIRLFVYECNSNATNHLFLIMHTRTLGSPLNGVSRFSLKYIKKTTF